MTRRKLGRIFILVGVGVWGVYLLFVVAGADPEARLFLPFHLAGVIPGAILARWPSRDRQPETRP